MRAILSPVFQKLNLLKTKGIMQGVAYLLISVMMFMFLIVVDRYLLKVGTLAHLLVFIFTVLLLGGLNYVLLRRPLYGNLLKWKKTLMVLGANLLGIIIFIRFSGHSQPYLEEYRMLFQPSILAFSIPWFFMLALRAFLAIPALEYLPLRFDSLQDIIAEIDWAEDESRGIVWQFENLTEMDSADQYWVRTHTPHAVKTLPLGELFKSLISLHNHNLSPGLPIHFENEGQPHGWRFYYEKSFLGLKFSKPLDPTKNFKQNRIHFWLLSKKERNEMTDLRKDLTKKFKRTKVSIVRITE